MKQMNSSDLVKPQTSPEGLSMPKTPVVTPFAFLSPSDLRGLAAMFAADKAIVSANVEHDGITAIVTQRDLVFIHQLDATRFGGSYKDCPFCQIEVD